MQEPLESYELRGALAELAVESKTNSPGQSGRSSQPQVSHNRHNSGKEHANGASRGRDAEREKLYQLKYDEMLFNSNVSDIQMGLPPFSSAATHDRNLPTISPPATLERIIPPIEYASRNLFVGSRKPGLPTLDAVNAAGQRPGLLQAKPLRRGQEKEQNGGLEEGLESTCSSHLHHIAVQEFLCTSASASSPGQTPSGSTLVHCLSTLPGNVMGLSTQMREAPPVPTPPVCTHAPLLLLLRQHNAVVQPLGLAHHCNEGTLDCIEAISFQPPRDTLHALAVKRGENVLSLSDADLALIGRHLPAAPSCEELSFVRCAMRPVALCTALGKLERLRRLTVWGCGLDAAAFAALLAALPPGLAALNAGCNDLSKLGRASAATRLKSKLLESSSITRRGTASSGATNGSSSGGLSPASIGTDLTPLVRLTALQELHLRRCNLSGSVALTLSPHVAALSALTSIDFSFNPMGKCGTKAIASALAAAGAPISELCLDGVKSSNGSFTSGIQGVLAELGPSIPGSLLKLSFSDCNLESNATVALADFLGTAPQLRSLDISRNSIGARGATKVAAALAKSGEIRAVSLGHNDIGNAGACAVVETLSQCHQLECLDLEAVGLTGIAVQTFMQVMPPQTKQEQRQNVRIVIWDGRRVTPSKPVD
jgi:hypothetical protein